MRCVKISEQASLIQSAPTTLERFSKGITMIVEVLRAGTEAARAATEISRTMAICKKNRDRRFGKLTDYFTTNYFSGVILRDASPLKLAKSKDPLLRSMCRVTTTQCDTDANSSDFSSACSA